MVFKSILSKNRTWAFFGVFLVEFNHKDQKMIFIHGKDEKKKNLRQLANKLDFFQNPKNLVL